MPTLPFDRIHISRASALDELLRDGFSVAENPTKSGTLRYSLPELALQRIRSLRGKAFPYPKLGADWSYELNSYLCSKGLRYLNKTRTDEEHGKHLTDVLYVLVRMNAEHALYDDDDRAGGGSGRMSKSKLWGLCESAAAFALNEWDPSYIPAQKVHGRAGGRASKRTPEIPHQRLAEVAHLKTQQQKADALGCTTRTIRNMLARQRSGKPS